MRKSRRSNVAILGWVLGVGLKIGFAVLAVGVPLAGVWFASSLAAYFDGPLWAVLLAGLACFPAAPLLWDAWATWRRSRRATVRPRVLTWFDRLVLRTLAVNLPLVVALLVAYPSTLFTALSSRGDWMLDEVEAPWAEEARRSLFAAADRMQWLHELTHPNAYEDLIDFENTGADIVPEPRARRERDPIETRPRTDSTQPSQETEPEPKAVDPEDLLHDDRWPFRPELHPVVTSIPAQIETSPTAVARYIAEREDDPVLRLKALHDYVADRIAYDVAAYESGVFPPQSAEAVFERGTAVCAGYAQLLHAMGRAVDIEIVVVVGKTRSQDSRGHAWNAAEIDGAWFLLDPTWNAGSVGDSQFTKRYETAYLMTPPQVFGLDHFPDDPKWQLREDPVSFGDFLRQPQMRPDFYAFGFELVSPDRALVSAREQVSVVLENPHGLEVSAAIYQGTTWNGESTRCPAKGSKTRFACPLERPGPHLVVLYGPHRWSMGSLDVQSE
jgi:transglutaminase-like putative cysteine protease